MRIEEIKKDEEGAKTGVGSTRAAAEIKD